MKTVCESLPNVSFAFCNSDEIDILLVNDKEIDKYKFEKLLGANCSVIFNKIFERIVESIDPLIHSYEDKEQLKLGKCFGFMGGECQHGILEKQHKIYKEALNHIPVFDCEIFTISKDEILDDILEIQNTCLDKSKHLLIKTYFNDEELIEKTEEEMIEMLKIKKDIDWK